MTPEQIAELRAAAEAATPGPWHAPGLGEIHMASHDSVAQVCFKHEFAEEGELFGTEADAQFIAAANPAAILALLDFLDAAELAFQTLTALDRKAAAERDVQVRASTIEECAKVCDRNATYTVDDSEMWTVEACAHDIRALALPAATGSENILEKD